MDRTRLLPLCLLIAASCAGSADPQGPPRNLILISIDTLRADRLGCYGYERDTTPALDDLAAKSARFERAYAPSSWTLPSHVSLLSGLLPSSHGVNRPDLRPGPQTSLLAEVLRDAGFYTFGYSDGGWISAAFDLDRGFMAFEDTDRDLSETLAAARETLAAAHGVRPFFAFLHTYDVHCPYTPGPPWDGLFTSRAAEPLETEGRCGNPHFNQRGVSPGQAAFLSDRYDGGLRRADEALAGFLSFLEDSGILEDTVVVVTSDHGEEFLEHGRIGHEGTLYREVLAVPLILCAPGVPPAEIDQPVGLVDLLPTLLDLLEVGAPDDLDGRSLTPLLRGEPLTPRPVAAQLAWKAELRAWIDGSMHLVEGPGRLELYDLRNDAGETVNLAREGQGLELLTRLTGDPSGARPRAPLTASHDPSTLEQLKGLGYSGD